MASERALESWRSSGGAAVSESFERLARAVLEPSAADNLDDASQEAVVDALAAANRAFASEITIKIAPRSIQTLGGRPWIEQARRAPEAAGRAVAETRARYGPKYSFLVKSPEQEWTVRISYDSDARDGVHLFWLDGKSGVAVRGENGEPMGSCSEDSPHLAVTGITIPAALSLRAMELPD